MNAEKRLARRCACARSIVATSYQQGMGPLTGVEDRLAAALRDVLAKPGSLTRALVAYLMGLEMGLAEETSRGLACGIEYLHTASLLFDDLPAMDNDQIRRGLPTVWTAYDEWTAILAGDALLTLAFEIISGAREASATSKIEQ